MKAKQSCISPFLCHVNDFIVLHGAKAALTNIYRLKMISIMTGVAYKNEVFG